MVLTHIGPGSVQFSTTPTDAELAEAARLLADLDAALRARTGSGDSQSHDQDHQQPEQRVHDEPESDSGDQQQHC